jgi:hypothetical protein
MDYNQKPNQSEAKDLNRQKHLAQKWKDVNNYKKN